MIPPIFVTGNLHVTREESCLHEIVQDAKIPVTPVTPVTDRQRCVYSEIKNQIVVLFVTGENTLTRNTCNRNTSRDYMESIHG